jgi:ATP phosphoribosyltransferase regulatory subunit
MPTPARLESERLFALFQARGAIPVEAPVLLPAETLLDLYGEDLRARAYVTRDPVLGEMMLRPDFTVPVVQMHMDGGADPARYTYQGDVFRTQEAGSERPREYAQVGIEIFDRARPASAEAEVFALVREGLGDLSCRAVTGDIGILRAAIGGLETSERRKAALLRHVWRPRRFRALLDRYRGKLPVPTHRSFLAGMDPALVYAAIETSGPAIGMRSIAEVAERVTALREDAVTPPIPAEQAAVLDDILALKASAPDALSALSDIAVDVPQITSVLERMEARLEALGAAGIDAHDLPFEASYGRSAMEYYDGFVFGFYVEGRPELPPVATGGRYDALTRVLGQGREIPAVGGVIRPGVVVDARGAV